MMDGIALIKALELQARARHARYSRNEDAFYEDYANEPGAFAARLIGLLAKIRSSRNAKQADRPSEGRTVCQSSHCCSQAASAR
jgi:hypothetical protein